MSWHDLRKFFGIQLHIAVIKILLVDRWVVADMELPKMNKLELKGTLELDDTGLSFTLEVKYLVIKGGRLIVGWPNKP